MVFVEIRNVLHGLANGRSLVRRTFHDQGLFKLEAVVLFFLISSLLPAFLLAVFSSTEKDWS